MMVGGVIAVLLQATAPTAAPPGPDAAPGVIMRPDWLRGPNGADAARYYPKQALKEDLAGSAFLACQVDAEGRLVDCKAEKVGPHGAGFGEAAVAWAKALRMRPQTLDGVPVAGGVVRIPVNFLMPANLRAAPVRAQHPEVRNEIVELDCRYTDLRLDNCFAQAGVSAKGAEVALRVAEHITLPSLPTKRRQGRIVLPLLFVDAAGKATPPALVTRPFWIARPTPSELFRAYPQAADETGLVGNVVVECGIQARGALEGCAVQTEDPMGKGFGEAALTLIPKFKMQDADAYGFKVEGRRVRVALRMSPVTPPTR